MDGNPPVDAMKIHCAVRVGSCHERSLKPLSPQKINLPEGRCQAFSGVLTPPSDQQQPVEVI